MDLGEMTLEEAAKAAAGNWKQFDSFAWHRGYDLSDADNWCIIYTHNRDSGLLDQSNASVIEAALDTFTQGKNPDVAPEHDHHWACGWVDGFSIRVFRRGRITKAFRAYHVLAQRLADYSVLDESDYSTREYEATVANLANAAWKLKNEYELPKDWETEVYRWFSNSDCAAVENRDDRGGWPSETQLRTAFTALGYEQATAV